MEGKMERNEGRVLIEQQKKPSDIRVYYTVVRLHIIIPDVYVRAVDGFIFEKLSLLVRDDNTRRQIFAEKAGPAHLFTAAGRDACLR